MKDYQAAPDLLKDRVILITGAGDGIGKTLAKNCAAHGATVILLGRTTKKLEKVYDEIEQAGYPQAAIYPMNLEGAAPKDYDDLAKVIETEFGRLDGLVNNAAIVEGLTPVANYQLENWFKVMQVNLNAPFMLTQSLLGLLNKSKDSRVIFTNDSVADEGKAYWGAYAVSKSGGQCLMKILADELETNTPIRVNSIRPGKIRTALRLKTYPGADSKQWAEPESIMSTYLYLLGPDSKAINGQTLDAD